MPSRLPTITKLRAKYLNLSLFFASDQFHQFPLIHFLGNSPHAPGPIKRAASVTPKYLTEHEIAVLFESIRKQPRRAGSAESAVFLPLYHHGLRRSEPGRMNLSDYRSDEGVSRSPADVRVPRYDNSNSQTADAPA
jgi:integrase